MLIVTYAIGLSTFCPAQMTPAGTASVLHFGSLHIVVQNPEPIWFLCALIVGPLGKDYELLLLLLLWRIGPLLRNGSINIFPRRRFLCKQPVDR
jgi:hypothetical protein